MVSTKLKNKLKLLFYPFVWDVGPTVAYSLRFTKQLTYNLLSNTGTVGYRIWL